MNGRREGKEKERKDSATLEYLFFLAKTISSTRAQCILYFYFLSHCSTPFWAWSQHQQKLGGFFFFQIEGQSGEGPEKNHRNDQRDE